MKKKSKPNLILKPFKSAKKYIANELYIPKAFKKIINIEDNPLKDKKTK